MTWQPYLTWQSGPGDRLTWHAGPPRRYDVALRPRGRTRVAHAGRAYGADVWPGATRTPVRGATWRGGAGKWRAHGLVGPG